MEKNSGDFTKGHTTQAHNISKQAKSTNHHRSKEEKIEYLKNAGLWESLQSNPSFLSDLLYTKPVLKGSNNDHVCILSAVDRSGNLYMKPVCLGNIESKHVIQEFEGRFNSDAILVSDGTNAYTQFAEEANIHHERVISKGHAKGPYSVSRINSIHSNFRDYYPKRSKRLPATKYLDLGLIFFWWQQKNKDLTTSQQLEELFACISNRVTAPITYNSLRYRPLTLDTKGLIPEYV